MTQPSDSDTLGYAGRADGASMGPRRRLLAWGRAWSSASLSGIWWMGGVILLSQVLMRGWMTGIAAGFVSVALAIVIAACVRSLRANRARRVLSYVEQSVRLALPMPEFLRAAAAAERRSVAKGLRRLAESLAASARLGDALRSAVPELPVRDAGVVRVAEDNGTLPAALARLIAEHEPSPDARIRRRFPWLYLAICCSMIPTIVLILAVFVMPKFASIFKDFNVPRPPWLDGVGGDGTIFFLALGGVAVGLATLLTLLSRSFRWILFERRDLDRPMEFSIDGVLWSLPLVGGAIRDRGYADVCQAVADGIGAARPADVTIGEAASLNLNATLADRVATWRAAVAGGRPIGAAARLAGLPDLIADLAGDGGDPSHAGEAFAFLARHYRGRAERTHEWLVSFASPVITVIAGAVVGTIAYGLFDAIGRLIQYTMPHNLGM